MTSGVQRRDSNVRNSEKEINLQVNMYNMYMLQYQMALMSKIETRHGQNALAREPLSAV